MTWALAALATALVVECFLRLPLIQRARDLAELTSSILKVLKSSSISDHWKEKVLPVYAGKLFLLSLILFGILALSLMPVVVIGYLSSLAGIDVAGLFATWPGLIASTGFAIFYLFVRNRVRKH